jgi:hypothetical protein
MSTIAITVTGTPPQGSYASSSGQVQPDGNIQIDPGVTTIEFVRGDGQAWSFESPWITFDPAGPFTLDAGSAAQVTIEDDDPGGEDRSFEYTLHTTEGNFDPQIINKGSGG